MAMGVYLSCSIPRAFEPLQPNLPVAVLGHLTVHIQCWGRQTLKLLQNTEQPKNMDLTHMVSHTLSCDEVRRGLKMQLTKYCASGQ